MKKMELQPLPADGSGGVEPLLRFLRKAGRLSTTDAQRLERVAGGRPSSSIGEVLEREQIITQRELALLLGEALHLPMQRRLPDTILFGDNQATATASRIATTMLIEDALTRLADGATPVVPTGRATNEAKAGRADDEAASVAAGTRTRSFRALVVDDDPDLRRIVRATIERSDLGLSVITAQSADEALALVDLERPDVVILDLSMPEMDGFEMCRRLRSNPYAKTVPVIVLTAADTLEHRAQARGAGADDFIVKPMNRDDFIARVREKLARSLEAGAPPVGQQPPPSAR